MKAKIRTPPTTGIKAAKLVNIALVVKIDCKAVTTDSIAVGVTLNHLSTLFV